MSKIDEKTALLDDKKRAVLSNFLWRFAERVGAQGVKLIVELVLARILSPKDYGLIALITVFITVLNVFVDSGLGNALIQKKTLMIWIFQACFGLISFGAWFYMVCFLLLLHISQFFINAQS